MLKLASAIFQRNAN